MGPDYDTSNPRALRRANHAPVFSRRDYGFELPPAQIAQRPEPRRDGSRLLRLPADPTAAPTDHRFADLLELLPPASVVVVNDTRVIPARVHAVRPTGGAVELLFVEPDPAHGPSAWRCLARARRPLRTGQELVVGAHTLAIAAGRTTDQDDTAITVVVPGDVLALLDAHGVVPLPPYIERTATADDRERYQTVYAKHPGAVAAPTAGLHLTPGLLDALAAAGHAIARLTLHVGLGTFAPVRADDVRDHRMHRERYDIPGETAALVATGRPIVAVGTTVLRALESAATADRTVTAGPGATTLFVHPGSDHRFRAVDHLVTNFHLPESTLLMLVCAFAGTARVLAAYRHAVTAGYRFFSYGDAMLVGRSTPCSPPASTPLTVRGAIP
jgi:S-adenosylmethionine:tRNA ribosyltransferase-isomerase